MSFIDWYNQYLIIIKLLCRAYNNASNPSLYPHSHFTPPHKNHLFMSCRYHNEYWIYRTLSCEYILWSKFRITLDGPPLKPFILSKWVGGHLEILVSARVVMICYWLPTCASRIPSIVCYRGIAMRLKETRNVYYKHPQFEFNSLLKGRPSLRYQEVFRGFFIISVGSILFLWNLLRLLLLHLKCESISLARNSFCTCLGISWIFKVQHSSVGLLSFNSSIDSSCPVVNPQEVKERPINPFCNIWWQRKTKQKHGLDYSSAWRFNSRHFCNGLWVWGG